MSLELIVEPLKIFYVAYPQREIISPSLQEGLSLLNRDKPLCFYPEFPTTFDKENLIRLSKAAERFFYNPNFLLFLSCIITSMTYSEGKVPNLKNWLDNSKGFSLREEEVEIFSSLGDVKRNLLLEFSPIFNLTHEALVGRFATNKLREEIPNFLYIYGGFSCAPPIIYKKKVYDFCWENKEGPYNYLVQERIRGETLAKSLKYIDGMTFLNLFLQVLLSLNLANREVGYTHYSLDAKKILLRNLNKEEKFSYGLERGRNFYLLTNAVATISNYNTSFFRYLGRPFLNRPSELATKIGDIEEFPLFDAYSLLRDVYLRALKIGNEELINISLRIAGFFSPSGYFLEEIPYLPPTPELVRLGLQPLILYIFQTFPLSFLTDNPEGELSCQRIECSSTREIRQDYDFITEKPPQNAYSLYVDYLNLPHDVVEQERGSFDQIIDDLDREGEEIEEEFNRALDLKDYIKLAKRWRDFSRQLREVETVFRGLGEESSFEQVDLLRNKYIPLERELIEKEREMAQSVAKAGRLVSQRNPLKYARYKNLYDYLNI